MEPNETTFLEQKQEYLRNNIDVNEYEDFYQFCETEVGNVDVNAWTMPYIQKLVTKYNDYRKKQKDNDQNNQHERTYNEYQSVDADKQLDLHNGNFDNDDCRSSRVMKSSAVDLLDQAFQNTSIAQSNSNNQYRSNSVSFEDFDFWTNGSLHTPNSGSSYSPTSGSNQNRQKSYTQSSDFSKTQNFKPQPSNKPKHVPTYDPKYSQNRNRSSTSSHQFNSSNVHLGDGSDLFMVPASKKQSPYLKKQYEQQPYQATTSSYYKEMEKPQKKQEQPDIFGGEHKIKVIEVKNIEPEAKEKESDLKGKWILEEKAFKEEVPCFKSTQRTQLNHPNLNVFIDEKYDIIHRSFLAADYPMYRLKVVPLGTQCKRNYDDFSKLKKTLQKFFPGMHLAYLEDGSWFNGTDLNFIEKQKKMIEMFMRDLLRNKQVRNSRVMEDFLTLEDHKAIKRKFQKYEAMADLKGIEELCLLDAKVNVTISGQQTNYINHLSQFLNKMDDYYSRHRRLTQSLSKQYLNMMQTMNSLIRLMSNIEKQIKSFNTKVTTNQIKHLGQIYRVLKETYKEDLSSLKFQYEITQKKITPFLKYEHENLLELGKILEIEKKMQKSFDKRSIIEKTEYGDDYNSEKARHGKRGITEESKNILVLKYQVGYFGYQARKQGQRIFDQMAYKIICRWQSIAQSYLDRYTKNIEYRKNLLKLDKYKYLPACALMA